VLVYATGFDVVASIDSLGVVGAGGLTLRRAFELKGGPEAYLGVAAPGFPNLFMMMGPNTGLGHSSMITMIEAQARYAAAVIARARARRWTRVEVRADATATYNAFIQGELLKNVWGGCVSWYNLAGAKNVVRV
jgi:cation diffusion facilitator CzcD-associated flavoprotein CzcO